MKKIFSLLFCFVMLQSVCFASVQVDCKSAILIEQTTGEVLFELNADEKLPPASVTKIMTMLLTMEAIDGGNLSYEEKVWASERAKEMGGSTIFLDAGEEMSVKDLLKGIAVASGNDACVAIAEHIAGSEKAFVDLMNNRAKELGMTNTHFENTNGLDAQGHLTTARDISIMSRELLKHEDILQFTTIWMDTLRNGQFTLANTNKLIRFYKGANGLKTGSTDDALFCISASAKRDNMQLIAVVMGGETSAKRFESAKAMLDFGFANYAQITPSDEVHFENGVRVKKGERDMCSIVLDKKFETLIKKDRKGDVKGSVNLKKEVTAPVNKGDVLGEVTFTLDDKVLGKCNIVADESINKKPFAGLFMDVIRMFLN